MTSLARCPLRGGSFRAPLASDVCFEGRRLSISLIWAGVFPRWFFIQLYRWFPSILKVLTIIQPDTLVRWHRAGFRCYWRWKSRSRGGRPQIETDLRSLIQRMSIENSLWGAPRIHGELLKLVTRRMRAMGIRDKPTAPASPWQNGFAERLIGSIRRECLDLAKTAVGLVMRCGGGSTITASLGCGAVFTGCGVLRGDPGPGGKAVGVCPGATPAPCGA